MKPSELLTEAAAPKVGRKYQHIEDLVLSDGSHGGLHAVERLKHMGEEGGSIELKWDGMPVVYWGRDEAGNFSLIPKNAWAYLKSGKTETSSGAPTVMRSPKDIQAFVLGTGGGDPKARQQFANQFASLWPYFEKISPKKGYLEGGLLFYPGNKPDGTSAMPVLNKETNTYDFTPNITTFHIPTNSELGAKIAKSKVMVAATGYYPTMGSSDEQRFPDAEKLSVPGVIVQGTTYVQEPVKLDTQGLANMEAFLKKNAQVIDNYLAPKPGLSNPGAELYTYLNKHLRTEGLLADFPAWANSNLSPKKAQTLLADPAGLKATLGAVEGLSKQKNILINQLSQGLHGGIKQTKPEGYAQAHPGKQFSYDIPGQFIKTIDQTNWSPKESVVNEAAAGKKAVLGWGRGMGHTGHDALVNAVIHQAAKTGATPYFVVSRSFGKDDPIPPETKLKMYQKKFPKYANMFSLPTAENPTLNDVLASMAKNGTTDVTLIVGADQKEAFGYLTRPDKSGVEPYKNFGLNSLTIMSRQDTKAPGSDPAQKDYHEGPRATPMREVLLDPNKTEQEQFAVWRQAMSPSLDDKEVYDMMMTAKQNLIQFHTPKPRRKASDIKEYISRIRPLLKEATTKQRIKIVGLLREAKKQLDASQLVVEGYDNAEAFKAHLIKSLPQIMKLFANVGKGWTPSEEQMLAAVDTGYQVMKHTGDTKQAGKAVMDELNALHRMSQGQQGVAESVEHNPQDLEDVADWMNTTPDKLSVEVRQEPIEKFIKQIREMYETYDEFPKDEARTNRILKLLKKGAKPLPMYVEEGDPDLFVMEGRHRMVAFWLTGMKTIPVAYVSVKSQQGVAEDSLNEIGDSNYTVRHTGTHKATLSDKERQFKLGGTNFKKTDSFGFETPDGVKYGVAIRTYKSSTGHGTGIMVDFFNKDLTKLPYDISGTGNEIKVFSTVRSILLKYLNEHPNINFLTFSAKNSEPSRVKLYSAAAKNPAKWFPGFIDVKAKTNSDITQYMFAKPKQGATEGQPEGQVNEYTVRNTKKFIQRAHDTEQGQKYGSAPYSSHPKAVANIGKKFFGTQFTPDAVKVALLHDVLEDTPYTPQQLAKKGFSKEIIQAVQLLTKNKKLSYVDNIKNIINSGNKLAMMVKYSDNYMNFTGDKSHWESDRAIQSNKKYLASLNMLGDVLGIKKHLGSADTNVTESSDYLDEK